MSSLTVVLWLTGLVLEALAFTVSNSENVPRVTTLVSPRTERLKTALANLQSTGVIGFGTEGFSDVVQCLWNSKEMQNALSAHQPGDVLRFHNPKEASSLLVGPDGALAFPMEVEFRDQSRARWSINHLRSAIGEATRRDVFRWSAWVFGAGVAFQLVGFVQEWLTR